jgi:serine/threonine protein kinase
MSLKSHCLLLLLGAVTCISDVHRRPLSMPPNLRISVQRQQRYIKIRTLGDGVSGTVFFGRDSVTGNNVAIKQYNNKWGKNERQIELGAHQRIGRSSEESRYGIARLLDVSDTDSGKELIFELLGPDLQVALSSASELNDLSLLKKKKLLKDMMIAVYQLHSLNVCSNDVKVQPFFP